jgi:hypothetical protein
MDWLPELFQCSRGDDGTSLKKQKAYRRFLGTIFFGEVQPLQVPENQPFARQQVPKNRKNTK